METLRAPIVRFATRYRLLRFARAVGDVLSGFPDRLDATAKEPSSASAAARDHVAESAVELFANQQFDSIARQFHYPPDRSPPESDRDRARVAASLEAYFHAIGGVRTIGPARPRGVVEMRDIATVTVPSWTAHYFSLNSAPGELSWIEVDLMPEPDRSIRRVAVIVSAHHPDASRILEAIDRTTP